MLKRTHHHGKFISFIIDLTADGTLELYGRPDDAVGVTIHLKKYYINNK
jgi:hypothetical protein